MELCKHLRRKSAGYFIIMLRAILEKELAEKDKQFPFVWADFQRWIR